MTIDLESLVQLHPDLPHEVAGMMAFGAAVALERRHHPGVQLSVHFLGEAMVMKEELLWRKRGPGRAEKIDEKRATEDGAEAIALGIVGHHRRAWRLVRRLQSRQGERADWLFAIDGTEATVVLEISGTDQGSFGARQSEKREQALEAISTEAAACVVRFLDPKASLWESHGPE
jgi:hypothetical protein